jgi:hypothetical protein
MFSAGATIDSFVVVTTDAGWVERFVERSGAKVTSTFKLATMKNLAVYWDHKRTIISRRNSSEWLAAMQSMVYTDENCNPDINYVLLPPNNLTVKLTHNEFAPETVPKFDLNVSGTLLQLDINKRQYHEIMLTMKQFELNDQKKQIFLHRPTQRPSKDPRGWWIYAVKIVLNRDDLSFDRVRYQCV